MSTALPLNIHTLNAALGALEEGHSINLHFDGLPNDVCIKNNKPYLCHLDDEDHHTHLNFTDEDGDDASINANKLDGPASKNAKVEFINLEYNDVEKLITKNKDRTLPEGPWELDPETRRTFLEKFDDLTDFCEKNRIPLFLIGALSSSNVEHNGNEAIRDDTIYTSLQFGLYGRRCRVINKMAYHRQFLEQMEQNQDHPLHAVLQQLAG